MGVRDRLRKPDVVVEAAGTATVIEALKEGLSRLGFAIDSLALLATTPDRYQGRVRLASGLELDLAASSSRLEEGGPDWISLDFSAGEAALGGFACGGETDWEIDLDLKKNLLEQERLRVESQPQLSSLVEEPAPAVPVVEPEPSALGH